MKNTNVPVDKDWEDYLNRHPGECDKTGSPYRKAIKSVGEIRTFAGGATRDTLGDKPSYVKALSPIALRRYVEYIGKHRVQSDGNLRDWDNWKKGMPQDVYFDGLGRHFVAVWLLLHGFPAFDNHGPVTLEDSLCGIFFNTQGILHEILEKKESKKDPEKSKENER